MPKNENNACVWEDWIEKCDDPDMQSTLKKLRELSLAPSYADAYNKWLEAGNVMSFLAENAKSKWVVAYLSSSPPSLALVYSAFVPKAAVNPLDIDDLLKWLYNYREGWCAYYDEPQAGIVLPLAGSDRGSKTLEQGEQLVFTRTDNEDRSYVEILQKFTHVTGVHGDTRQGIWYKIGRSGKKEAVIRVLMNGVERVVFFRRDVLSIYAELTNSVMVRVFDFTKYKAECVHWVNPVTEKRKSSDNERIHYRNHIQPDASYSNGFQLVEFS